MSNTEKYNNYDIWNVKNIGVLKLDGMILFSFLYEQDLFRKIQQLYPGQFPIYRFYENKTQDIFLYKGVSIKPLSNEVSLLKIGFVDMCPSFCNGDNDITRILEKNIIWKFQMSRIFFLWTIRGKYKDYRNCKTVLWITEPSEIHLDRYDYAFGYPYINRKKYLYYNPYTPRNCFINIERRFQICFL